MSFNHIFESMIRETENHRTQHISNMNFMCDRAFKAEFCNLGLRVPRQCGKTKFIMDQAKIYNSMIITNNIYQSVETYLQNGLNAMPLTRITHPDFNRGIRYIRKYKYIFLDEVSFNNLSSSSQAHIFESFDADSGLIVSLYTGY